MSKLGEGTSIGIYFPAAEGPLAVIRKEGRKEGQKEGRKEALAGNVGFLQKPFTKKQFQAALEARLAG